MKTFKLVTTQKVRTTRTYYIDAESMSQAQLDFLQVSSSDAEESEEVDDVEHIESFVEVREDGNPL